MADWSFTMTEVMGVGVLRVKGSGGWFLDRVVVAGRDVSDMPLDFDAYAAVPVEIHLTRRQTRLAGTAVGAQATPTILERLAAQATMVTLGEGESRSLDFRLIERY